MAGDPALAELYEAKAQTYAAFGNGAIAAHAERLLPPAGRVLDIGCASGGLLALLRPRAAHLTGLELSPTAARAAAQIGDEIVCGSLEDPQLPFEPGAFDLVVLADVLEHVERADDVEVALVRKLSRVERHELDVGKPPSRDLEPFLVELDAHEPEPRERLCERQ